MIRRPHIETGEPRVVSTERIDTLVEPRERVTVMGTDLVHQPKIDATACRTIMFLHDNKIRRERTLRRLDDSLSLLFVYVSIYHFALCQRHSSQRLPGRRVISGIYFMLDFICPAKVILVLGEGLAVLSQQLTELIND